MKKHQEFIAKWLFFFCTITSAVITVSILIFMIVMGLPLFKQGDFFSIWTGSWKPHQSNYGILPMIAGTLWIALPAAALSFPFSLGTAFVISGLGGTKTKNVLNSTIRFMTGIPTIIYGFAGIFLLAPLIREGLGGSGMCVLAAVIVLSVLISPTMILFFSDSLSSVNPVYIQSSKALGASRVQRLIYVMVPHSIGGMASGFILALGRALGDTLIALMISGNAVLLPSNFLEPARTLTAHIALVKAADFDSLFFRSIFACGITLYMFTAMATFIVRFLERKRDLIK